MKLIASRKFNHNGKLVKPGEMIIEEDRRAAEDLIAVGAARGVNNSKKANPGYKRRDIRAEE